MLSLEVLPNAEEVAAEAANRIAYELQRGARTLVLAGGTTPQRAYELLAEKAEVEWGRVAVLFGDERCVPWNDPESNFLMAKQALLDRVGPAAVYRMPGELGPDQGAVEYEKMVAHLLPLDLVILGVGEDGHTASLFPGHPGLEATGTTIGIHDSPKPPPERITLTLPVLQSAKHVLVLATGAGKAEAVAKAKRGEVPSGMITRARWLIDQAAAGR